jgi:hypothetical protein
VGASPSRTDQKRFAWAGLLQLIRRAYLQATILKPAAAAAGAAAAAAQRHPGKVSLQAKGHSKISEKDHRIPEGVNRANVQICALFALGSQSFTAPLSDWYHFCFYLKLAL